MANGRKVRPRGVHVAWRTLLGLSVAAVLTIASMLAYPGGTTLDHTTSSYSFARNFLSDLGMTAAFNGDQNAAGATLFVLAVLAMLAGLSFPFWTAVRLCWRSDRSRRIAKIAGTLGIIVGVAFIGVAFTPENSLFALHLNFTLFAFALAPAVTLLLAIALRASTVAPRKVTNAFVALTIVLAVYVVIQQWGPRLTTPAGLTAQVLAQKAVVLASTLIFAYIAVNLQTPTAASRHTHR